MSSDMRADQAIYTSLPRDGRDGYHVVSRSRGVSEADARALASWSPSHGSLIVDDANRVSVNVHPLTDGRFALSRTCEGRPEYSGRGGRQIYTHALILDAALLERSGTTPLALYRDALALGHFRYRADPEPVLDEVELGRCHRPIDPECWANRIEALGVGHLDDLQGRLLAGEPVQYRYQGDRTLLADCLLGLLPGSALATLSVSTSLHPSSSRPFQLSLIG